MGLCWTQQLSSCTSTLSDGPVTRHLTVWQRYFGKREFGECLFAKDMTFNLDHVIHHENTLNCVVLLGYAKKFTSTPRFLLFQNLGLHAQHLYENLDLN